MMYTHVERRRRSIICRPAAQGDHRGGKAVQGGRGPRRYGCTGSVRPPARRGVRAAAPTGRGRDSCGLWAWRGLARTASLSRNSNGGQPHPQRVAGAQAEPPRGLPTARVDQPARASQTKPKQGMATTGPGCSTRCRPPTARAPPGASSRLHSVCTLRIRSVARSLLVPVHVRTTWIALLISLGSGRPCSSHPLLLLLLRCIALQLYIQDHTCDVSCRVADVLSASVQ